MDLYEEEIYDRANINITVIVNDNIKEAIIKNLKNNMKDKNVNINSYNYNNIHGINSFTNDFEKVCEGSIMLQGWLKKVKMTSSVIIFCIDWQNIIYESNYENEFGKKECADELSNGKYEQRGGDNLREVYVSGLNGDTTKSYFACKDDSNEGYLDGVNPHEGNLSEIIPDEDKQNIYFPNSNMDQTHHGMPEVDSQNEQIEEEKKRKIFLQYPCIKNAQYMKEINSNLIRRIEEINEVIMKRKKICKIIVLVILPENAKNTEEYIKYISFLNSQNISAIFITLGLREIHNKIKKLENLLTDCINSFFKQYLISYENKSSKNMLSFFKYNFKKAYILEILEKYDESMKIYVNICKMFYENVSENVFPNKTTFFEYVLFFNYISIRMIFIYLYFKDIKKSIHHIYTHKKIIFLALMTKEENEVGEEVNTKLEQITNAFNITGDTDFIRYIKHFVCNYDENGTKGKEIMEYVYGEEANKLLHLLYDTISKECLYYNLLSCIYFYFYRIIKNFNISTHDIVLYGIYCCFCIYYQIQAITKRSKLVKEFPNIQFGTYFKIAPVSFLFDFVLNFLIEIFRSISVNKITSLARIIIYLLCLIYYEKGNYMFCLYLLLLFFNNEEEFFLLTSIDTTVLKSRTYELSDFYSALRIFGGCRRYLHSRYGTEDNQLVHSMWIWPLSYLCACSTVHRGAAYRM
ncbi:conserved Plasmodium protein, unknown function [Plasmodium ovale wallikeri]|uniref:Uncharacterized protein n=1 Tax=Plasmodium ovale wallikeri TaxID=864142 RepID=A0A1A8YLV8_PLAOA|nr:conserved Plasmodium protein, unknown function [Plasmodium ovale wallikeri]SBT32515.1 conserved Plasmodium protein, unknown function [Plasmodium ovale wallikeri]